MPSRLHHTHAPSPLLTIRAGALLPVTFAALLFLGACRGELTANQDTSLTGDDMSPGADQDIATRPDGGGLMQGDMIEIPASDCGVTVMYQKLSPTCATCHRSGSTPYFASPESFYNLLVTDPKWISPGDPSSSNLIALLRGEATGAYAQMPLGAESFLDLEQRGATEVTIDELSTFITELDGCQRSGEAPNLPAPIERKRARQIVNTLYQHLGLTKNDVLPFTKQRNYSDNAYPIYNPDDTQPVTNDPHISPATQSPGIRWYAIGGGSRLYVTQSNAIFSPTFGQAIIQISQAWCGFSIKKEGNDALFRHVSREALGEATEAQIRDNIAYLMLRFWGHVATDEEIAQMKSEIYDAYIDPAVSNDTDEKTAWQAVCASLIRDPLWLSY